MKLSLESQLKKYIATYLDKGLILSVEEAIRLAYSKAHYITTENIKYTDPTRPRAQLRRYFIDDALAGLFSSEKNSPTYYQTNPRGERFIVIQSGKITLSHIELHENQLPRKATYREGLSKGNDIMVKPFQEDLFIPEPPPSPASEDMLHLAAVVIHPSKSDSDKFKPKELYITVPYANWTGYHLKTPFNQFISEYEDSYQDSEFIDNAWPTLKDIMKKKEDE